MSIQVYSEGDLEQLLDGNRLPADDLGLPEGHLELACPVETPDFEHGFGAQLSLVRPITLSRLLEGYSERIYELLDRFGSFSADLCEDSPEIPGQNLMDIIHPFHVDGPFARRLKPWAVTCLKLHPNAVHRDPTQVMAMDAFAQRFNRTYGIPKAQRERNPYLLINRLHDEYDIASPQKMWRMQQIQRGIFIDSKAGFSHPWARQPHSVLMFLAEQSRNARRALHARLFARFLRPSNKPRLIGRFLDENFFPQVEEHREGF